MGQIRKRGGVWWIRYYRNGRRFEERARSDKGQAAADSLKSERGRHREMDPTSLKSAKALDSE